MPAINGSGTLFDHEFSYDNRGNLVSANYGYGEIRHKYDAWDRITEVLDPERKVKTTYGHFSSGGYNGKITSAIAWEGIDYTNKLNEVITKVNPVGNLMKEKWKIKDNTGNLVTYALAYEYDGVGRLTQMTYPDNQTVAYSYSPTSYGRLDKLSGPSINGTSQIVPKFKYTDGGLLKTIRFGNQATTTITHDGRGRPLVIETEDVSGNEIFYQRYTYDNVSNITSINDRISGSTQSFTYDQINRLRTAVYSNPNNTGLDYSYRYGYNGTDNRTLLRNVTDGSVEKYTYEAQNVQLIKEITKGTQKETFTHNSAGAITTRAKGGSTTSYSYDGAGRLKQVKVGANIIAQYEYDAYGRLIKTIEGNTTTFRLPMGNETAYEKVIQQGMPTIERRYILALGKYIARDEIIGTAINRVYYHGDHLGSTRALSGEDSGSFTYDPFGNIVSATGDAEEHNHRFTGKPMDGTGLYYYGARFYDPTLGRFIDLDPAKDGLNWYVYVNNNPLKYVDPDGYSATPWLLNWMHFGGRVHRSFQAQVLAKAPLDATFVELSLSSISRDQEWEISLADRWLRPDAVYDKYYVLELKPAGNEAGAVAQAAKYVNKSYGNLALGNSEEFMLRTFGAPSYKLPSPVTDNLGKMYEVTVHSHGSTAALTYTKRYIGRNEAYDSAVVTIGVTIGVTLVAPQCAPALVPALLY